MPPGRPARARLVSNENDENSGTTRMTRAKAAALHIDELAMPSKGALQTKKSASNSTTAAAQRKRAALGDVSNVGKNDGVEGKKGGKVGLVSKAAQPTGIQKSSSRATTKSALTTKDTNKKPEDKRTKSGSGALGNTTKRKASNGLKEHAIVDENEPARKEPRTLDENRVRSEPKAEPVAKAEPVEAEPKVAPTNGNPTVYPADVEDRDSEDIDDPLMVAEYANEIFEYLRDLEVKCIPNPQYMSHQDDLEWKTRGILVDWLIEVHTRFHLLPETLFLAVNIIDRFLSEKVVQLDRLQLVGITAMFIASKYEEVLSPHVENFKRIADDGFTEAEILSAERFVLTTLDYDLSYPNPMNFLRRVSKADNYDIQSRTIGKYLMEISLLDHRFMAYRPSHVAAGAMYLSRLMLDRGEWDATLTYYAGFTEEEVEPVVKLMVDYLARPVVHEAFFKKYASKKFLKASFLARQWAKANAAVFGITDIKLTLDQIS
ncbi:G2/mitotic-specific cyclin-B [Neonectria ditissima]|uniref:G2/mitotic-specific cyclin-B n=1 Tax=Neonectria ditissima TaxID=78410 RepID=A0A0P7AZN2_9HYPO|nr:G2/mitotic-specific cyclin-B [Neonectria ditissima]